MSRFLHNGVTVPGNPTSAVNIVRLDADQLVESVQKPIGFYIGLGAGDVNRDSVDDAKDAQPGTITRDGLKLDSSVSGAGMLKVQYVDVGTAPSREYIEPSDGKVALGAGVDSQVQLTVYGVFVEPLGGETSLPADTSGFFDADFLFDWSSITHGQNLVSTGLVAADTSVWQGSPYDGSGAVKIPFTISTTIAVPTTVTGKVGYSVKLTPKGTDRTLRSGYIDSILYARVIDTGVKPGAVVTESSYEAATA